MDPTCECKVHVSVLSTEEASVKKCLVELLKYSRNILHKPATRQLRENTRSELREALLHDSLLIVANKTAQNYAANNREVPNYEPTLSQLQKISSESNEKRKEVLFNVFASHHERKKEDSFVRHFSLLPAVRIFYFDDSKKNFRSNHLG